MSLEKFKSALHVLDSHGPSWGPSAEREKALLSIGDFLASSTRQGQPCDLQLAQNPVWGIVETRLLGAVLEMETDAVPGETVLWQMYNSGAIIRSRDVFFGLDVIPMLRAYGWGEPEGLTEKIAHMLDFLLISHSHTDHYDKALVRACLDLGKPVCMPGPLAREWERNSNLHAVEDGWTLDLADIRIVGHRSYHVWRETMEEMPLAYYEVTCQDGYTFVFGGDVDYTKKFETSSGKDVDLFFLPWRSPNEIYEEEHPDHTKTPLDAVKIAISGIRPKAILYEHCGELEHVYDGFPPSYDIALRLKEALSIPSELLFWGEHMVLT